jgi:aminopeptidase N
METYSQWNYKWDVPITVVSGLSAPSDWDAGPVAWINIDQTETTITGVPDTDWVIINAKQNFFYRVLYDSASLNYISAQLDIDHSVIDAESRSAIVEDTFALSRAGYVSITYAMDNTRYLDTEFVYNAWGSILKHIQHTNRIFRTETWFATFQSYVVSKSSPVNQQFGWVYSDTEPILTHFLRRDMVSTACSYGEANCLATARQQYSIISTDPASNSVDPNNLPTVLCTGVKEGSAADWTLWLNVYLNRKSSQIRDERYAYLFGLSCTSDTVLLDRYLDELTVQSNIAQRDRNTATQYLAVLDYGGSILWDYLDANWSSVRSGINRWTSLNNIIAGFSTAAQATQLNDFIGRHPPLSEYERNQYAQMVLLVQQNIDWRTNNANALRDWLASQPLADVHLTSGYEMTPSAVHHWAMVVDSYKADYKY